MTEDWDRWLRSPEPGWVDVDLQQIAAVIRGSFVSGEGSALSVHYFRAEEQAVRAKVVFGPRTQGPPGLAHGGCMAAVLDEMMGFAVWCSGHVAVSADLHVHYRKMLPIPQRCIAEARVERVEGRKLWTSARLLDVSVDTLFAEADGVFLEQPTVFSKVPLTQTQP